MFRKRTLDEKIFLFPLPLITFVKKRHLTSIMDEHDNAFSIFLSIYLNSKDDFFGDLWEKSIASVHIILVLNKIF